MHMYAYVFFSFLQRRLYLHKLVFRRTWLRSNPHQSGSKQKYVIFYHLDIAYKNKTLGLAMPVHCMVSQGLHCSLNIVFFFESSMFIFMRPFPRYQRLHASPPQPPNRHPHAKSVMTRESARVQKNLNILRKKHNIWWTLWSSSSVFIIQNAVKFSQRMRKKSYHCKSFRKLRLMCSFFWKVTGSVALLFFGQMKITHD